MDDAGLAAFRRTLTMLFWATLALNVPLPVRGRPWRVVDLVAGLVAWTVVALVTRRLRPASPEDRTYRGRLVVAAVAAWLSAAGTALYLVSTWPGLAGQVPRPAAAQVVLLVTLAPIVHTIFVVLAMLRLVRIAGAPALHRLWLRTLQLFKAAFVLTLLALGVSGVDGLAELLAVAVVVLPLVGAVHYLLALWRTRATIPRARRGRGRAGATSSASPSSAAA